MSEPGVRVERLTKIFRSYRREEGLAAALKSLVRRAATETVAVSDVTFSIEPGEMVGYIGANGAGKSTTIKMLTGILTPTSGRVLCNGFVPHEERTRYVATIGVVLVSARSCGGTSRWSSRSGCSRRSTAFPTRRTGSG